ncbi:MAG TPA: hypothetical protein GXZ49_02440 [Bacteroidetes bacterium]|nr:hypothetical protein [Bacteroidota bacterium]
MKQIFCFLIFNLMLVSSYAQKVEETVVSHYLFPEFIQSVLLTKTGIRNSAILNYNSLTEEVILDYKETKVALTEEDILLIDTIYVKDRKFFILEGKFVEFVHHSDWDLYVEHKCDVRDLGSPSGYGGLSQTTAVSSYLSLYTESKHYNLELPENYEIKPYSYYWIKRNGKLEKFINMSQLKKMYKDKKQLFKEYTKKNDVNFENQQNIIQLITYLELN